MEIDAPTVVCAWCGKVVTPGGPALTHGICEPCAEELLTVIEQQARSGNPRPKRPPQTGSLGGAQPGD